MKGNRPMKRIIALLLACIMLLGAACAGAEEEKIPDVDSYDFDLRFQLNADAFPFRERKQMQGYAELLEALVIRGNYSWCEETDCLDLHLQLVPANDPDAALSIRIFGWLSNWLNISSPLLGEDSVCFRPKEIMYFVARAWDFFEIPLFPLAVLFPGLVEAAYREVEYEWIKRIAVPENGSAVIPRERQEEITEGVREQLENDVRTTAITEAMLKPLREAELVQKEISALPDLLIHSTEGEDLTVEADGKSIRYLNHRGETLYEEHSTGNTYEAALTLPPSGTDYTPSYSFWREDGENEYSFRLNASWDRTSGNEEVPETFLRLNAVMDHVPTVYPTEAEFSGEVSVEGILLPELHLLVNGTTGADGTVSIGLTLPDRQEEDPVFTCTGTVVPAAYEGKLEYMIGDIITDYNLFALSDQSLTLLLGGVVPAMMEELPDFLYAMPTHGIQSILDTLEQYGLLQITLQ